MVIIIITFVLVDVIVHQRKVGQFELVLKAGGLFGQTDPGVPSSCRKTQILNLLATFSWLFDELKRLFGHFPGWGGVT